MVLDVLSQTNDRKRTFQILFHIAFLFDFLFLNRHISFHLLAQRTKYQQQERKEDSSRQLEVSCYSKATRDASFCIYFQVHVAKLRKAERMKSHLMAEDSESLRALCLVMKARKCDSLTFAYKLHKMLIAHLIEQFRLN